MRNRYIYFYFDHFSLERQAESITITNSSTKCIKFWKDDSNKATKKKKISTETRASIISFNCNKTWLMKKKKKDDWYVKLDISFKQAPNIQTHTGTRREKKEISEL
jgi:hypothetical protein